MPSVQEFINSTLRLIRVLDAGETPTATESDNALTALNQLIGSWSAAGVPVYQESREGIDLTGASLYPLPTRPVRILSAMVINGGVSFPVAIVNSQQWTQPKDRTATSKFAKELYYDGGYPVGSIFLWPSPGFGSTLNVYVLRPLSQFASLADTISLPPGYEQALRFGLAGVLAPEYGSALPPEVAGGAAQATTAIASMNAAAIGQGVASAAVPAAS
jgi:hypothetical protein